MIKSTKTQSEGNAIVSSNPFVVLSTADEHNSLILEEGEVQQSEVQDEELEANRGPLVSILECLELLSEDTSMHVIYPMRTTSPSCAEALKKRNQWILLTLQRKMNTSQKRVEESLPKRSEKKK